ncbi:SusC/RagA family TonB-linked outer membrane protein [Prevotella melaninogenica]|uniref:SusC/RagA family TonB-linked outer membrane protein n=1 Tax=Prevotella melaninogenica TaxID=28132 RepID=UPI0001AEB516|nr:SusC/RagA family TonB-linked outer membrane protein [Prevotella melaninogenica]ADK97441.1 TonB-linked outer membrane protein, SusC/RagA family [Prevotella melaninogenica ATCC 25845]ASE18851.1 SusC/RagA family TonB-linked outer membrane protein [Prevotella melaninogenica]UEB08621.1 SusC/RagA family TonB-linked outer membrane protein [Prevotella melaninogenica]
MRMIHETKQKHLYFSVAFALSIALAPTSVYAVGNPVGSPDASMPQAVQQNGNHKVTGRVVDSAGEPLIGATIMVEGTKEGAVTDIDGNFTINTTSKAKLVISYVGYTTQTIPVGDKTTIDVTLKEVANTMNEVVVTALGIKRAEKALSYNVQSVGSNELTRNKDANFVNSLNGKVAGVSISKSASGVGGATRVIMRGAKSIEGDNNVLYVIDGIPIFNFSGGRDSGIMGEGRVSSEGIADLNPEDIESISVLAGPSAAALYGSNAANGAILITTKKGKEGRVDISFSSSADFSSPLLMPKFQNTYGNKLGSYESWGEKLATPSSYDPKKDFFRTGTNFINALTLNMGNEFNQTFASVATTNSRGIVPNNTYDRYNFTIRNTTRMFKNRVQLDLGASYIKQKDNNMVSQGEYWNPIVAAYLFPRGESFEGIKTFERYDNVRNFPTQYWPISDSRFANQNPYWTAYRNLAPDDKDRFMFNAGLTYNIFDWLSVAGRIRLDKTFITSERKIYASSFNYFAKEKGAYDYYDYKDHQTYIDAIANINKTFGKFSLAANVGYSYSDYASLTRGYGGNLVLVPNKFSLNNINPTDSKIREAGGDSKVRNVAAFASAELGWRSMVYLTLTGRNDWNSRLVNSSEESFFYPSVGLSGIISEMTKLPSFISYLKVRGSYTEVGSPVSRSGMTPGTITTPIVGGSLKSTDIYPFTDYKAERTKSYEFGLTARFWKKLSFDFTWYKSNTYNQTFIGELPESSGYKAVYLQAGNVENRGVEMALGYSDNFGGLQWNSSLVYSKNVNEIKEMVKDYHHPLSPKPINIPEVSKDNGRVLLKVGGSINDIYARKVLAKDNQGFVNVSPSGGMNLETVEPIYLGKTTPDFTMGWNNNFTYKNFGLSFLINARVGGIVTSSTQALLDRFGVSKASADARDAGGVMIPNQGLYDAKKYYTLVATGENDLAGYYTYSATNVRLQELTLSYKFNSKLFNNVIKDLTLSFVATNPWMIYCKAPFDPELTASTGTYGQGNDYFMQPSLKSYGFSVKFKF